MTDHQQTLPVCPEGNPDCAFSRSRFDGGCIHYWRQLAFDIPRDGEKQSIGEEPQQTPQENVPFAIRDIAANEPAQTRDEGDVQSFMADAIERGDHAK